MTKRVELLAPCGSYESFLAAVNAGADAVYLGGKQFGARAYAENFAEEELSGVIRQALLWGVKVYLTVNTLVKEQEFSGLYEYIAPLCEAGLDGAIVQDMGVLRFLRRSFPDLKLHASTQMTVTGVYGAAYLKELGCGRIVPARELSLEEIREIRRKVSVEVEAFIHGAMCYCYSGQCLMSSMIGGRSGNRGRCAGPCRLPYRVAGKEGYYLSLKDMNTLEHIPELIEAGIDSFKIEGRMKKPEYVAGVVSVYRKYIDQYYEDAFRYHLGDSGTDTGMGRQTVVREQQEAGLQAEREFPSKQVSARRFRVEERDKKLLSNLYIRSEAGYGCYEKRNGRDMLTLCKPGYNEADPVLLARLRERYIHELPQMQIRFFVRCRRGEPLYGEVWFPDRRRRCSLDGALKNMGGENHTCEGRDSSAAGSAGAEICLSMTGDCAECADRRTVGAEEIALQMKKTGGTPFAVKECLVDAGEGVFISMSRINALRRALLQKIYAYYGAAALSAGNGAAQESIGGVGE